MARRVVKLVCFAGRTTAAAMTRTLRAVCTSLIDRFGFPNETIRINATEFLEFFIVLVEFTTKMRAFTTLKTIFGRVRLDVVDITNSPSEGDLFSKPWFFIIILCIVIVGLSTCSRLLDFPWEGSYASL